MKTKNNVIEYRMKQDKKGGNFFSGLLWGAALGGGTAYVLSTKRGRDLLKELVHDGLDLLEKDMGSQKKAIEKVLSPIREEEIVSETELASGEKIAADKKRFFKKDSKK